MDTALPQKFPFILDRNLAKANCTGNFVCTSCDTVVLAIELNAKIYFRTLEEKEFPVSGHHAFVLEIIVLCRFPRKETATFQDIVWKQ